MNCVRCAAELDSRSTFCPVCGTAVPDPLIGTEVAGRYRAEKRIAIGTFGSIYRAVEIASGRDIALKVMHRELAADANLVERFRREGLVLRRLLDPHIVATYELGETAQGLPFIAMELLAGDTLLALFRAGGRLPWQRAFAIGKAVCGALGAAHGLGVVHRDLKPANILITDRDVVKVLDFGIAKIMSNSEVGNPRELTIMGTAVGTLEYMAPEQLMGGKADGRTDIYTLGVVLYEVVVGHRPFNAAGFDLLAMQVSEEPPAPSQFVDVPPDVDRVLRRCLAQDIDDRYPDVHALARDLDAALTANPPAPPRVDPLPRVAVARPHTPLPAHRPVLDTEPVRKQAAFPLLLVAVLLALVGMGFGAAYAWLS